MSERVEQPNRGEPRSSTWVTLLTAGGLAAMVGVTGWLLLVPGSEQPTARHEQEAALAPPQAAPRAGGSGVDPPLPLLAPAQPTSAHLAGPRVQHDRGPTQAAASGNLGLTVAPPAPLAAPAPPAAGEPSDSEPVTPPMVWSLDREGIRGAMRESSPQIKECYEGWLQANPGLAGRFTAQFTIGPSSRDPERGAVQAVGIRETQLHHPLLEGCILNVVSALQFERPTDGEVKVNYPFLFRSAEEPEGTGSSHNRTPNPEP